MNRHNDGVYRCILYQVYTGNGNVVMVTQTKRVVYNGRVTCSGTKQVFKVVWSFVRISDIIVDCRKTPPLQMYSKLILSCCTVLC